MTKNLLIIAALGSGLALAAGAASTTPLASASKTAVVFDHSEAGVQPVFHGRRHFRRHGHGFHGPSIHFGFGLHPFLHGFHGRRFHGHGFHGPSFSFGLSAPHGHFGFHRGGFHSFHGEGQGR